LYQNLKLDPLVTGYVLYGLSGFKRMMNTTDKRHKWFCCFRKIAANFECGPTSHFAVLL